MSFLGNKIQNVSFLGMIKTKSGKCMISGMFCFWESHVRTCVFVCVCVCVCAHMCVYVCMYVCAYMCITTPGCMNVWMYTRMHVCKKTARTDTVREGLDTHKSTHHAQTHHTYKHTHANVGKARKDERCLITTSPHTCIIMPSMCAREQHTLCYLTPYRAFWWCSFAAKNVPRPSPYHPHCGGWEFESPQLTRRHFPARLPALRYGKMCHTRPTKKTYKRDLYTPTESNKRDLPKNTYTHPKRLTKDTYWLPRTPRHFPAHFDAQRYGKYV